MMTDGSRIEQQLNSLSARDIEELKTSFDVKDNQQEDNKKELSMQEDNLSGIPVDETKHDSTHPVMDISFNIQKQPEKLPLQPKPAEIKQPKRTSVVELIGNSKPAVQEKADGQRLTVFVNKKDTTQEKPMEEAENLFKAPIVVPPKMSVGDSNNFTVEKRVRNSVFEREEKPKDTIQTIQLEKTESSVPAFSLNLPEINLTPSSAQQNVMSGFNFNSNQNIFGSGPFLFGSQGIQAEPPKEEYEKEIEELPQPVEKEIIQDKPFENKYYFPKKYEFISFEKPVVVKEKEIPTLEARIEDEILVEEPKIEVTKDGFKFDLGGNTSTTSTTSTEQSNNAFSFGKLDFGGGFGSFGTAVTEEKKETKTEEPKQETKVEEKPKQETGLFSGFSFLNQPAPEKKEEPQSTELTPFAKLNALSEQSKEENKPIFGGFKAENTTGFGFGTTTEKKEENTNLGGFTLGGNTAGFNFAGFGKFGQTTETAAGDGDNYNPEEETDTRDYTKVKLEVKEKQVDTNVETLMDCKIKIARLSQETDENGVSKKEWKALGEGGKLIVSNLKKENKKQLAVLNLISGTPYVLCGLRKGVVSISKSSNTRSVFKCYEKEQGSDKFVPKYYTFCFEKEEENKRLNEIVENLW